MSDTENQTPETAAQSQVDIPNPDKNHDVKEFTFGFRTLKDKDTGVETKRDSVTLKLPILSFEGIVSVLTNANTEEGKKSFELLQSAIESVYTDFVKDMLANDPTLTTANFPVGQVTWDAIANQPESERRGRGIAKEVWEDFIKDYIATMPALTGKTEKQIEKQAAVLAQKLQPLKSHEDKEKLLPSFKSMLTVYANGSKSAEQFAECIDFLTKKADSFLNAEKESNLAANLGF